jgi:hypothetical protein
MNVPASPNSRGNPAHITWGVDLCLPLSIHPFISARINVHDAPGYSKFAMIASSYRIYSEEVLAGPAHQVQNFVSQLMAGEVYENSSLR